MTLKKVLEIYMQEIKLGLVSNFKEFKKLHRSPLLRHVNTYAQGMMLVNINSK